MKRIAILGGGISGLTAAYELELGRRRGAALDWHLFEANDRLGGIVETTRLASAEGEYILEGGPDAWVSEKPWARELAVELGLESELIHSNDATRKTYIVRDGRLLSIPDGMRLMIPQDLAALDGSPLFSAAAKQAYAAELARASELKATALPEGSDESVASFVSRHFGEEVTRTLAAPLLAGVFGGDVHKLSVRAVMPQFVTLEREHGSLIAGLQARSRERGPRPHPPIFTSLRRGMASLTEALVAHLPADRLHLNQRASKIVGPAGWQILFNEDDSVPANATGTIMPPSPATPEPLHGFDHLIVATNLGTARRLLSEVDPAIAQSHGDPSLLPEHASSAILAALTWPPETASTFTIPPGFGFLVPPDDAPGDPAEEPSLLACTFVDQKFPLRAPAGARVIRAFFGGSSAERLADTPDAGVIASAVRQLETILGSLPPPEHALVRRWPGSLPQYEVGHLDRLARLQEKVASLPGLHLLGNSYAGVGIPDLIRAARTIAREIGAASVV